MTTTMTPEFLAGFEAQNAGSGPEWLDAMRRASLERFRSVGLPTTKQEEWRQTSIAPIRTQAFRPGNAAVALDEAALPAIARLDLGGPRLVFLDAVARAPLTTIGTLPDGVWVGSLARAIAEIPDRVRPHLERRDPGSAPAFGALNGAFGADGAVIVVPDETKLDVPIQLLYGSSGAPQPTASHPRTLIVVGRGSEVQVVETYFGSDDGVYLTNAVTDVVVGDNARVEHCRVQTESTAAFHISQIGSLQGRDSQYTLHHVDLGARLARHELASVLDGEGAHCQLHGLYLIDGEQHIDNHTVLDHAKPHGDSREVYKGILGGRSRAVFNGRIIVRPDAQKTDAKQSNPNLLLSDHALAHTRPQLEIYADDVKCTHGATIGRLDEEAIFYLRSRAVPEPEARNLLIRAFADEVLLPIPIAPLRDLMQHFVRQRLDSRAD